MTTLQAIAQILSNDDYLAAWLRAGFTKEQRRDYKRKLKDGQLSLEKQDQLLEALGFTVKQEKQWNKPY